MTELTISANRIPAMSEMAIDKVRQFENASLANPQVNIDTLHIIHGGMYARTIMVPAGVVITGALIKIATMLIIVGDAIAYIGDEAIPLCGYNILPASANRKQAFVAQTDIYLTMIFPTKVSSISEAEDEFTDEANILISRNNISDNKIIITGE